MSRSVRLLCCRSQSLNGHFDLLLWYRQYSVHHCYLACITLGGEICVIISVQNERLYSGCPFCCTGMIFDKGNGYNSDVIVVSTTSRPLYPRDRPGTHCTGGWVGPRAGLDVCEKSRPHRDSIPGPSSPYSVAIPTELPGFFHIEFQLHRMRETYIVLYCIDHCNIACTALWCFTTL
jgi:hypothetical protein